jgi:hypothetical protein
MSNRIIEGEIVPEHITVRSGYNNLELPVMPSMSVRDLSEWHTCESLHIKTCTIRRPVPFHKCREHNVLIRWEVPSVSQA